MLVCTMYIYSKCYTCVTLILHNKAGSLETALKSVLQGLTLSNLHTHSCRQHSLLFLTHIRTKRKKEV